MGNVHQYKFINRTERQLLEEISQSLTKHGHIQI